VKFCWNFDENVELAGTKIKPEFTQDQAKQLLYKSYGISTLEICELNSYDDRNFLVYADK
jgi:hydroxylysine kinase